MIEATRKSAGIDLDKLEQEGLVTPFNLKENEIAESAYNLLGFFQTLNDIYERLKKEGKLDKLYE